MSKRGFRMFAQAAATLALAALLWVCGPVAKAESQHALSGRVTDGLTGAGIPGVGVTLYSGMNAVGSVATDDAGCYRIEVESSGFYKISARKLGYNPIGNVQVLVNGETRKDIEMAPSITPSLAAPGSVSAQAGEGVAFELESKSSVYGTEIRLEVPGVWRADNLIIDGTELSFDGYRSTGVVAPFFTAEFSRYGPESYTLMFQLVDTATGTVLDSADTWVSVAGTEFLEPQVSISGLPGVIYTGTDTEFSIETVEGSVYYGSVCMEVIITGPADPAAVDLSFDGRPVSLVAADGALSGSLSPESGEVLRDATRGMTVRFNPGFDGDSTVTARLVDLSAGEMLADACVMVEILPAEGDIDEPPVEDPPGDPGEPPEPPGDDQPPGDPGDTPGDDIDEPGDPSDGDPGEPSVPPGDGKPPGDPGDPGNPPDGDPQRPDNSPQSKSSRTAKPRFNIDGSMAVFDASRLPSIRMGDVRLYSVTPPVIKKVLDSPGTSELNGIVFDLKNRPAALEMMVGIRLNRDAADLVIKKGMDLFLRMGHVSVGLPIAGAGTFASSLGPAAIRPYGDELSPAGTGSSAPSPYNRPGGYAQAGAPADAVSTERYFDGGPSAQNGVPADGFYAALRHTGEPYASKNPDGAGSGGSAIEPPPAPGPGFMMISNITAPALIQVELSGFMQEADWAGRIVPGIWWGRPDGITEFIRAEGDFPSLHIRALPTGRFRPGAVPYTDSVRG